MTTANNDASAGPPSDPSDPSDPNVDIRRWFLITLFIASFGVGMISLASTYIIYDQTGSLSATGLIMVALNIPSLVFPGWATRLANRWGGTKLYFISGMTLGVIGFIPAVLSITGDLTTANLLGWYLLSGVIYGLSSPASGLLRRSIAAPGQVPEFNGAATRSLSIATVAGLLIGGALFALVGPTWIYVIAAVAHFPICVAIYPAMRRSTDVEEVSGGRFLDAFSIKRSHPGLQSAFMFTGFCFIVGAYSVTFPAIATSIGTNAGILSLLQAAAVVGGLFVVVAMRKIHGQVGWGSVQRVCFLIAGVAILVLAWINHRGASPSITLIVCLVAIVPIGFALNLDTSILNALVQMAAPGESRNSVLTYFALIPTLTIPLAQEGLGGLSDLTSVSTALVVVGVFTLGMIALGPRWKLRTAFDELDGPGPPPSMFPVGPQVARPDIVTAHSPKGWAEFEFDSDTGEDTSIGTIVEEVGPIADQQIGPEFPDRPEAER